MSFQKDLYPPIRYLLAADPPAFIFLLGGGGEYCLVYFGCCSISGSVFLAEKPVVVLLLLMWTVNIGPESFLSASFISSGTANFYAMQEYADPHDFAGSEIL